jgi:hypothetical protein
VLVLKEIHMSKRFALVAAALALAACSSQGATPGQLSSPSSQLPAMEQRSVVATASTATTSQDASLAVNPATQTPLEVGNLDYSNGTITVYYVENTTAFQYSQFTPEHGTGQGIAIDSKGRIYTAVTNGHACTCVEVFTPQGRLVNTLVAPTLKGAPGPASLVDVSVDASGDVFVSDSGQGAVYEYPPGATPTTTPRVIVNDPGHVGLTYASPDGQSIVLSGCSFASARIYRRDSSGDFIASPCFFTEGFLWGTAIDDHGVALSTTDPENNTVIVFSQSNVTAFNTPHGPHAGVTSIAMSTTGDTAYVTDAYDQLINVYTSPGTWINGGVPKLVTTYKGFHHLDLIAIPQ